MKSFAVAIALVLMAGSTAFAFHPYVATLPVPPTPYAAYYAPQPVVPYYAPAPTVAYFAPAPTYYSPVPAVTYYAPTPMVVPAPVAVAPVYGRAVVIRPKVYVAGQPVRNVLRAVTP